MSLRAKLSGKFIIITKTGKSFVLHEIANKISGLDALFASITLFIIVSGLKFGYYLAKILILDVLKKMEEDYMKLKEEIAKKVDLEQFHDYLKEISSLKEVVVEINHGLNSRIDDTYKLLCEIAKNTGIKCD